MQYTNPFIDSFLADVLTLWASQLIFARLGLQTPSQTDLLILHHMDLPKPMKKALYRAFKCTLELANVAFIPGLYFVPHLYRQSSCLLVESGYYELRILEVEDGYVKELTHASKYMFILFYFMLFDYCLCMFMRVYI